MRTPSEYVAAAVRRIQSQSMPDCAMVLRHGDCCSKVTRAASFARGEEPIQGGAATEKLRVLALGCDFPAIAAGEAVELNGSFRLVTSARRDPSGSCLYVGVSDSFSRRVARYTGERRSATGVRLVEQPSGVLAMEGDLDSAVTESVAPTRERMWSVVILRAEWTDETDPEVGDRLDFADGEREVSVLVAAVTPQGGYFHLTARTR